MKRLNVSALRLCGARQKEDSVICAEKSNFAKKKVSSRERKSGK